MSVCLPEAFVKRMGEQLGEELPSFLREMEKPSVRGIRMNPSRTGGAPFRDAKGKIAWCGDGWELADDSPAGVTAAHEAGAFYLQEPGAMIPAEVMAARPGEIILDLCAAPGGKSTQMGAAMKGRGLLICNEPIPKRTAVLSRNLERRVEAFIEVVTPDTREQINTLLDALRNDREKSRIMKSDGSYIREKGGTGTGSQEALYHYFSYP